ncbi:MAG: RNA polymerase sigma factor [Phycisphaerae bacterium]|nr:RNA polymerase sigma factor [Phycisphaerae bacterium]MDD5380032.1 RNA polymerase sigma factor [Phycisphaerae bacterium]
MEYSDSSDKTEQSRNSLAARLRAGNRAAAAELVDIYYEQLYVFFRRLGHSQQVSEDLTQESFIAAWQHIGQLRSGKTLNSWMYRIAGNLSNLHWRGHRVSKAVSIEEIDVPDGSEPECDKTGHLEEIGHLKNAVAELPRKLRQAVILHYMQHLTIVEAADAAGVRCGTFKSRLNRALKKLKRQMGSENGELL